MQNTPTAEDYLSMSVEDRRVLRTGTLYPNRKQRRGARTRFEKLHRFMTEELGPVLTPIINKLL